MIMLMDTFEGGYNMITNNQYDHNKLLFLEYSSNKSRKRARYIPKIQEMFIIFRDEMIILESYSQSLRKDEKFGK